MDALLWLLVNLRGVVRSSAFGVSHIAYRVFGILPGLSLEIILLHDREHQ